MSPDGPFSIFIVFFFPLPTNNSDHTGDSKQINKYKRIKKKQNISFKKIFSLAVSNQIMANKMNNHSVSLSEHATRNQMGSSLYNTKDCKRTEPETKQPTIKNVQSDDGTSKRHFQTFRELLQYMDTHHYNHPIHGQEVRESLERVGENMRLFVSHGRM
jgi:hypothetical protein